MQQTDHIKTKPIKGQTGQTGPKLKKCGLLSLRSKLVPTKPNRIRKQALIYNKAKQSANRPLYMPYIYNKARAIYNKAQTGP